MEGLRKLRGVKRLTKRAFQVAKWCFGLDNWPLGASLGLGLTLVAFAVSSTAVLNVRDITYKYGDTSQINMYVFQVVFIALAFVLVHVAVFVHGVVIGVLQTQRELQCRGARECCRCRCFTCCAKSDRCHKTCVAVEWACQEGCQLAWAIFGTVFLFVSYVVGLLLFLVTTVSTGLSFTLAHTCGLFRNLVKTYIEKVEEYIALAKAALGGADSTMRSVLAQYQKWVDLQAQFENSGIGQVAEMASRPKVGDGEGAPASNPLPELPIPSVSDHARYLLRWLPVTAVADAHAGRGRALGTAFDPQEELDKGRSIVAVLNSTIDESHAQVKYYNEQFDMIHGYCVDFAALYDSFFLILVAVFCVLISELIMFAVHTKHFSTWDYEMLLLEQQQQVEEHLDGMEDQIDGIEESIDMQFQQEDSSKKEAFGGGRTGAKGQAAAAVEEMVV
jgi:hypothetical protein